MRYDYRELLRAKEAMDNSIEYLKAEKEDTMDMEIERLEQELINSGIVEEYCQLIELVDDVNVMSNRIVRHYYQNQNYQVEFATEDSWLRNPYRIGIFNTYGSCGDHSDSLYLNMLYIREHRAINWTWANGTAGDRMQKTLTPDHTRKDTEFQKKKEILQSIFAYFDTFRERVLEIFNYEMEKKTEQVKKLGKEIAEI